MSGTSLPECQMSILLGTTETKNCSILVPYPAPESVHYYNTV